MKRNLIALFLTGLAVHAFAAVPPGLMNYQGVLRNASNAPQSGTFDMEFAFYDDIDPDCGDGTLLLTDSHLAAGTGDVTVSGGLFNTTLGSGLLAAGVETNLSAVFGSHTSVFMEVRIEGGGGGLETLCPRIRVVSAGYSLSADNLDGLDSTSFINTSNASQTKLGQLTVGSTTLQGNQIFFATGAALQSAFNFTSLVAGNEPTDSLFLTIAPGADGAIELEGGGAMSFWSPGGSFRFISGGFEKASLTTAGSLQLDGTLNVDGNAITFADPGAAVTASPSNVTVTGGDAATDDLVLRATPTSTDGQIVISGNSAMTFTAGTGQFIFVDGATSTTRAGIDSLGNLQIDGILDEDLVMTIGNSTVATVQGNPAAFTIGGTSLDLNLGDSAGDGVDVIGTFTATGTKSFVQNHPYERDLSIYFVALEGDEAGTYTRGSGRVSNGVARVSLGETFAWVTNPDIGLTAQVTPRGEWADLYVESVTSREIVVRSRDASVPAAFDFIVYGLRIGYEDFAVVRQKTTESTVPSESAFAAKYYADRPELRAHSALARFQRMEGESGLARPEPIASRALRQAIGENNLGDELAAAQRPAEADSASIPTTVGASREQPSSDDAGGQASVAAGSTIAGSLPVDAEGNVNARSLRPSAEHMESLVTVAEPVEAGDVVVIDAEKPGVMNLARTAADSAVFGVVADEFRAVPIAASLGESATAANGGETAMQVPVALSGIVLCKVDARLGAIRAGDLLTTSLTPGHAMRAQNPRAGTIVGKALESLAAGTGRIKILVMLH